MDKTKRDRSANFSLLERNILVSLVQKYQSVLENKQSDGTTWKKKEDTWKSIEGEFNARSGSTFRSTKTLKIKYEGLKRNVRKKSAIIRSELYRTGGGKSSASPLDDVEEQIKCMISLSTDGMQSVFDSDTLAQTPENKDDIDVPLASEFMEIPQIDIAEVVESEASKNYLLVNECETLPPITSAITDPGEKNDLPNMNDITLHEKTGQYDLTPSTSTNKKWDVTSRRNLKSRKHPALIASVPKRTLFDELTQAKLELVQLQKVFLEAEIIEKNKVWEFEENERKKESEFKEKERKWKEEEYKLKLERNLK